MGSRTRTKNTAEQRKGSILELTDVDLSMMVGISQTTANIFELDDGAAVPIDHIHDRVFEIIKLNPWLLARLISGRNGRPQLLVPNSVSKDDLSQVFKVAKVRNLSQTLKSLPSLFIAKNGVAAKDKDETLWKFTVMTSSSNKYSIVVSMSHVLGDGATFYSILNMLHHENKGSFKLEKDDVPLVESADTVFAMNATRVFDADLLPQSLSILKDIRNDKIVKSAPTSYITRCLNYYYHRKSWAIRAEWRVIDLDRIKAIKEETTKKPSSHRFVSTNDILVSDLMPDHTLGLVPIDLRENIEGFNSDHAGNVIVLSTLSPMEHSSPLQVRTFMNNHKNKLLPRKKNSITGKATRTRRFMLSLSDSYTDSMKERADMFEEKDGEGAVPKKKASQKSFTDRKVDGDVVKEDRNSCDISGGLSVSTNWSGFYKDVSLPNSKALVHFPIHNLFAFKSTTIFKCNANTLAVRIDSSSPPHHYLGPELKPFDFLK